MLSPLTKVVLSVGTLHGQSVGSTHCPLGPMTCVPGQTQPGVHLSGFKHILSHVNESHDVSHSLAQSV